MMSMNTNRFKSSINNKRMMDLEGELLADNEVEKALKKFRKATEMKHKMEQLEQKGTSSKEENEDNTSKKGDEERGMSQNEYVNLKANLKAKLKRMVPVSFEMLDHRIEEIEKRIQNSIDSDHIQQRTLEKE